MLTKNDFSASDWNTLRDSQYLVGLATLMADSSGFGTIKESMALAQSIMENQASNFPFIRDLTSKAEMDGGAERAQAAAGGPRGQADEGRRTAAHPGRG